MAKRKVFIITATDFGLALQRLITDKTKVLKMQYADGSDFEDSIDPKSLEVNAQEMLFTVECASFPDVKEFPRVPVKAKLLDTGGMAITDA